MDIINNNNATAQPSIQYVYVCSNCGEAYPIYGVHICKNPKYPDNSSTVGR